MRLTPVFLLVACTVLTSPSSLPDSWEATVESEWSIAAGDLKKAGVPHSRIVTIKKHDFSWKPHDGTFVCAGVEANGCYRTGGAGKHASIEWNTDTPSALQHEIGHAILHKLGYSCWKEYQHTERSCP